MVGPFCLFTSITVECVYMIRVSQGVSTGQRMSSRSQDSFHVTVEGGSLASAWLLFKATSLV